MDRNFFIGLGFFYIYSFHVTWMGFVVFPWLTANKYWDEHRAYTVTVSPFGPHPNSKNLHGIGCFCFWCGIYSCGATLYEPDSHDKVFDYNLHVKKHKDSEHIMFIFSRSGCLHHVLFVIDYHLPYHYIIPSTISLHHSSSSSRWKKSSSTTTFLIFEKVKCKFFFSLSFFFIW